MQTIETVYLGPTDTKGARIKARSSGGGSAYVAYDHGLSTELAHAQAADKLRRRYGWGRMYLAGATKRGFVFAFAPEDQNQAPVWIGR